MAEEKYRRFYKEEQTAASDVPRRLIRIPIATKRIRPGYAAPGPLSGPAVDYSVFKETLASAVKEIIVHNEGQHQQTRAEVQTVRLDVLAAVKASPTENVKLASEFGMLFLLFSLAVRFLLKIELVNTTFALFMLPALAVYWAMARLKQRSDKRGHESPQS